MAVFTGMPAHLLVVNFERNLVKQTSRGFMNMCTVAYRITLIVLILSAFLARVSAAPAHGAAKLIFEEQRIEGKIRRPQLVLIKAESRPVFEPMVMESFGKRAAIVKAVNQSVIDESPYRDNFKFEGKSIINYMK